MSKLAKLATFNSSGPVHYRVDQQNSGRIALSVDYERAPEPDHSYIADYFEVHRAEADVVMVFGKTDFPVSDELRNKIEIYFPIHSFMHQLWKSTRAVHKSLRETFASKGKKPKAQGAASATAAKVQTLAANNAMLVSSGGQCTLDFFIIAAKDVWLKTQKNEPLNISAIVRVFTSEHLLLGLLNRCDEIAQEVRGDLEIPVIEERDDETLESVDL